MKNILATLDLKTDTSKVLGHAVEIARARQAKLWLLHVAAPNPDFVGYEAGPQYIRDARAGILRDEDGQLEQMVSQLKGEGLDCQPILVMGATVETILTEAERINADLVVMGTHGRRGLAKAFMGSTCDEVLRANKFPVLVVPTPVH